MKTPPLSDITIGGVIEIGKASPQQLSLPIFAECTDIICQLQHYSTAKCLQGKRFNELEIVFILGKFKVEAVPRP